MSSYPCKSTQEAERVRAIMEQMGYPAYVSRSTVSTPEPRSVLNKALKRLKGQDVVRAAAESKSMMEDQELI